MRIRLHLDATPLLAHHKGLAESEPGVMDPAGVAEVRVRDALSALRQRVAVGVEARFSGGVRLPYGDVLAVELRFVDAPAHAHSEITVIPTGARPNSVTWTEDMSSLTAAHEIGHHLGLPDEYRESQYPLRRAVYPEDALMMGGWSDLRGEPWVDGSLRLSKAQGGPLRARDLRLMGATIESALLRAAPVGMGVLDGAETDPAKPVLPGTAALEQGLAPAGVPELGLPARAVFGADVRRQVLYGDPVSGASAYLMPRGATDRLKPVRVGDVLPNTTFRAVDPADSAGVAGGGPAARVRAQDDTAVGVPRGGATASGRVMFPAHWGEDDAVYAAEQAYLHSLRTGSMSADPRRVGRTLWTGVYAGVRIEGEVVAGEFTSFRPSEDQSGLTVAPFFPPPLQPTPTGVVPIAGPRFSQRVRDLVRTGDRRARVGVHQVLGGTLGERYRGVLLGVTTKPHENGTFRALPFFLEPGLEVEGFAAAFESRWHAHVQGYLTMFPRHWSADEVLDRVSSAHAKAVREQLDEHSYRWVGMSRSVRIEGVVRDGEHIAYRPTALQPAVNWPEVAPVGLTMALAVLDDASSLATSAFRAHHQLFPSGDHAVVGIMNVRIIPTHDADPHRATEVVRALQRSFDMSFNQAARAHGAGLATVQLHQVGEAEPARLVIEVGPEEISEDGMLKMFNDLVSPEGDSSAMDRLVGLASVRPADDEWTPRSAGREDGDALRAAVHASHLLNAGPSMDTRGFYTPAPPMDETGMTVAVPPTTLHAMVAPGIPSVFHPEVRVTFPPNAREVGLTNEDMVLAVTTVVRLVTRVDVPGQPGRQIVAGAYRRTALHVEAVLQDGLVIEVHFTLGEPQA
ncbi:EndoU domain-containing protein [Streptomyces sp. NPDC058469]|uniref:EndoU domain-containing protein n=1 Tax=Streptomyces sp. NPDC058469 TaxID=3346514 RepID=UPI00365792FA